MSAKKPGKRGRNRPIESTSQLHQLRVDHARVKTRNILRRRIVCYRRELERQVCEVNFDFAKASPEERVEPHHFSEAVRTLVEENAVREHEIELGSTRYRFWSLSELEEATIQPVLGRKVDAFRVFNQVEHTPELSGWHAEHVHHLGLLAAKDWVSVGWSPGHKIVTLGAHAIAKDQPGDVDLAGHHRSTGIPFASQVKNGREWIYPPDDTAWDLLGSAAQLHAVPILIARRLPDSMFTFMKLVGGFAARSTKMIFPPGVDELRPIEGLASFGDALAELGFRNDVDFINEPLARHRDIWTGALTDELSAMHERFLSNADLLFEIAYGEGLARDNVNLGRKSRSPRSEIVQEFLKRLRDQYRREAIERAEAEREAEEVAWLEFGEGDDPFEWN